MLKKCISSILLLTIFSLTATVIPSSKLSIENENYFPLVVKSHPDLGVVVTKRYNTDTWGYNFISGYVINWGDEPYYSTSLAVDIIGYPYCDPSDPFYTDCDPYMGQMSLNPAFSTTLPGQVNPFVHSNLCYKACTDYFNVRVASASHNPTDEIRYFPLTLVRWEYTIKDEYNFIVSGSIRNDTEETLQNLRLVLSNLEYCSLKEAEINDELLKPGRRTTFQIKEYKKYCLNDNLVFIGQGEALP